MNYVVVGKDIMHRRQFFAACDPQTRRQLFADGRALIFRRRKDAENYLKKISAIRREVHGGWC